MSPLREGWTNWRANIALVPALYGLKLALALLFTLPIFVMTSASIEYSAYPTRLVSGWDLDVISELFRANEGVAPTMLVVLISFVIIAFLVKQFLNGGLYSTYLKGRLGLAAFLYESARQTTTNLKISILMLPVYLLLIFMGGQISRLIPSTLTGRFGAAALGAPIASVVVIAAFVLIGVIISESLRLHRAMHPERHGFRRVRDTLDFLRRNGVRLYGYYLVYLVPFVAIWLIVEMAALSITGGLANGLGVLLELLLFQICACVRTGQSLLFTATVAPIFRAFRIDDAPEN